MADKINKIREWILYKQDSLMDEDGYFEYPEDRGAHNVLSELDDYIDSLEEGPVSEELEYASRNYADNEEYGNDVYFAIEAAFEAGAKWQKEKDDEEKVLTYKHSFEDCKEHMMKEVIDGIARPDDNEIWCDLSAFNFKDGDKCKVIVIKED